MKPATAICFPISWLLAGFCGAQNEAPPKEPMVKFGTTVVMSSGFRGEIYHIPKGSTRLPNFKKLNPIGTIYTNALNVPPTDFREGFPGVTSRIEWFAIDYSGRFWIERPGKYHFSLASDDGSKLYLDGRAIIRNDGLHPTLVREGNVTLSSGVHNVRVSYFQGPGGGVALILMVAGPGEDWHVFNMDDFSPHSDRLRPDVR